MSFVFNRGGRVKITHFSRDPSVKSWRKPCCIWWTECQSSQICIIYCFFKISIFGVKFYDLISDHVIIQLNLRVILNPNLNTMYNTDLKSNPTHKQNPIQIFCMLKHCVMHQKKMRWFQEYCFPHIGTFCDAWIFFESSVEFLLFLVPCSLRGL